MVLSKVVTIHQNTDFRRVYGRGKSCVSPALVVYCLKNRAGICRIGITTSKKLGGAVERNRCRRVIKEAYRRLQPLCSGGWDIVLWRGPGRSGARAPMYSRSCTANCESWV